MDTIFIPLKMSFKNDFYIIKMACWFLVAILSLIYAHSKCIDPDDYWSVVEPIVKAMNQCTEKKVAALASGYPVFATSEDDANTSVHRAYLDYRVQNSGAQGW